MQSTQNRRKFVAAMALVGTGVVPISLAITNAQETPSPAASPMASPAASPMASPVAGGQPQTAVTVEMVDIAFNPNELTIAASTDVTVTLPNTGVQPHTFTVTDHNQFPNVMNLGIDVEVQPGQTGMATVNAPAADYYFYCKIPGHEEAGMHGVMHVQ
jgi:uncharacterized cupredoxin-like copper-binding protein